MISPALNSSSHLGHADDRTREPETRNSHQSGLRYVLITAARNEEAFIGGVIRSVVAQTARPARWIIVSDGSTDRTDEFVTHSAGQHAWIELLRMPEHRNRQFAAKAHAVRAALERLRDQRFQIVGNLDADVSFGPDYMAFLIQQFATDPTLGVAGTPYIEPGFKPGRHSLSSRSADLRHVSGPCQMFRRECFEQVGGYMASPGGAIDWIAVTSARMHGWRTRSFPGRTYLHHRKMGCAEHGAMVSAFRYGRKAYAVGGHPFWELTRGIIRMRERPYILGGAFFLGGYFWDGLVRSKRPIPDALIAFHRAEQMARLKKQLRNCVGWRSEDPGLAPTR